MSGSLHSTRASSHLSLIRGVAALAVLVYHVRYRFFFDYGDLTGPSAGAKAFYALTAFGHDAVIVFFVLSGYLISSSVMRDCAAGRWSWGRYALNRWVRLAVVLVPGLLLTACWDGAGLRLLGDNPVYSAAPQPWRHDFFPVADRAGWGTFFGNLFFLQSVVVPPYGSNDPLWSLSYEFWYYVLFPCAWIGLAHSTPLLKRAALGAAVVTLLCLLGKAIALYFPLWLLGAVVARLRPAELLRRHCRAAMPAAAALFLATLALSHTGYVRGVIGQSVVATDYLNGCACAVLVYVLLHDRAPSSGGRYTRAADGLAGFSYTLYIVHMPALVFLRAALVPGEPWLPDPARACFAGLLCVAMIAYAAGVARLTEARTDRVRAALLGWLGAVGNRPRVRAAGVGLDLPTAMAVREGRVECHSSSELDQTE